MHRASSSSSNSSSNSSSRHRSSIGTNPDGEGHLGGSLDAATLEGATVDRVEHLPQGLLKVIPFPAAARYHMGLGDHIRCWTALMFLQEGCCLWLTSWTIIPLVSSYFKAVHALLQSLLDLVAGYRSSPIERCVCMILFLHALYCWSNFTPPRHLQWSCYCGRMYCLAIAITFRRCARVCLLHS
jgi:hypothetical protein